MIMPSLNGAVVLVTGANGGIGTHLVRIVFDAAEAGQYEVLADETSVPLKAALSAPLEALHPQLVGSGA